MQNGFKLCVCVCVTVLTQAFPSIVSEMFAGHTLSSPSARYVRVTLSGNELQLKMKDIVLFSIVITLLDS